MQYIPCNSALLAKETLFMTQKGTFFQKVRKSRQTLIRDKIAYLGQEVHYIHYTWYILHILLS